MTTIAYVDNIIAVDSLAAAGDTITHLDVNKIIKSNGVVFVMAGAIHDFNELIKAYHGEPYDRKADVSGIIDDNGTVFRAAIDTDGNFWKLNITGIPYAAGFGADHAWTALDLGCSAKEAVKMAAKRDMHTGGRIRIHKVKAS